ncbi:MAG: hypothetical protein ACRCW2_15920, partial [Cellulosilyticaceae bacterium]
YTVEILMLIFGGYFTFFAKDRLPTYYDENKISYYSHGIFRMNLCGVKFNNSNWQHIVKVAQLSIMSVFAIFPAIYFVMQSFYPLLWQKGQGVLTLSAAFIMFVPMYIVGKKYE